MSGFVKGLPQPRPPEDFGRIGGFSIRPTQSPRFDTPEPDQLAEQVAAMRQQPPTPDIVRVMFGIPDRELVVRMVNQAQGNESGLVGVPTELVVQRMKQLGLPTDPDAWTKADWDQKIAEFEAEAAGPLPVNPVQLMEF